MWRPGRSKMAGPPRPSGQRRGRLAALLMLATALCLGSAFVFSKGTQWLMPGPLTSAHAAIKNCNACHTQNGSSKLSWLHGLIAANPHADSKACLACHTMPDTAFNAHSASSEVLKQSTSRLTKIAAESSAPLSARAQKTAFPMHDAMTGGLNCATCHREHQGISFNLNKISNEQCRSCHVVQFDSFDGHHPKFENYPFKRRTRIIYDHAGHFEKHFPEVAKKDPTKRIPATCSACHNSNDDRRVMAVVPFEQTCTACHLDQIIGKERVSGPKGIAFLALPGLDLETLKKKNIPIGEWPEESEAALTPFMKVMISRNERGRALLKAVDRLNLQDLSAASDDQIKAVNALVWEIKGLFYALIKGKASDVLDNLTIGGGAKLTPSLVSDLTASIPRDVVTGAQQQWLPNLAAETSSGPSKNNHGPSGSNAVTEEATSTQSASEDQSGSDVPQAAPALNAQGADSTVSRETDSAEIKPAGKETHCIDGQPTAEAADSQNAEETTQTDEAAGDTNTAEANADEGETVSNEEAGGEAVQGRLPLPTGTPRAIKARIEKAEKKIVKPDAGKKKFCADGPPPAEKGLEPEAAAGAPDTSPTNPNGGKEALSANEPPPGKASDQTDDLLFPTEEELHASKTGSKEAEKTGQPAEAAGNAATVAQPDSNTAAEPQAQVQPAVGIESDVDPENWADYGGWYRQDYTIFYRPTGHMDKFITSWLTLTGPQAPRGDTSPAAAVFDFLTNKDAPGSCTKCHSVDIQSKGRVVNFTPASVEGKRGRFTNFIHEPHFGILDNRGCFTCHSLEKDRPYLKSYEQGNPLNFVSNFNEVKKELCQTCHASGMARQDCLLCHKYHVNGAVTPITDTKNTAFP